MQFTRKLSHDECRKLTDTEIADYLAWLMRPNGEADRICTRRELRGVGLEPSDLIGTDAFISGQRVLIDRIDLMGE